MIILVAHNSNNGYIVNMQIAKNAKIGLKFDTGASFTTIPYELLQSLIDDKEKYSFQYYGVHKQFKTVSEKDVNGVLCSVENVKIGAINLPKLYFYMIFNTKRDTGLLGYEMIDNFVFKHDISGDIIISEFDDEKYNHHILHMISNNSAPKENMSLDECYQRYVKETADSGIQGKTCWR